MRIALLAVVLLGCSGPVGPPGPQGEQGPAGPTGPIGPQGATLRFNHVCRGFAQVTSTTGYALEHNVYDFSDGSVFTSCEVSGASYQVYGAVWYRSSQVGADTGACFVSFDVDTSTSGYWRFEIDANNASGRGTYTDPGSTFGGRVVATQCETF